MNRHIFVSRKHIPLPQHRCNIEILLFGFDGPDTITVESGEWIPFREENYTKDNMPCEGYLGSVEGMFGYHAWMQNESEFEYYRIIKDV